MIVWQGPHPGHGVTLKESVDHEVTSPRNRLTVASISARMSPQAASISLDRSTHANKRLLEAISMSLTVLGGRTRTSGSSVGSSCSSASSDSSSLDSSSIGNEDSED